MASRAVQGLVAAVALAGLAGCGSVSAGSTGHPASAGSSSPKAAAAGTPAGGPLCASGLGSQGADRVVVSRTASPRQVTLTGATQVRAMVAALCALPPLPAGQHCAVAAAGSVRLVFAAGETRFPPVTVQESGCRTVTGMGTTRWWSGSSSLGRMLDEAVGGLGRLVPGTHPSSVPFGT
jgi:hypothetical protein